MDQLTGLKEEAQELALDRSREIQRHFEEDQLLPSVFHWSSRPNEAVALTSVARA